MRLVNFAFILLFFVCSDGYAQNQKPVIVIVHGAWGGGWAYKKVDSLLTEKGGIVYRPTLTGQGERVHLATKEIGLTTHINDVVNTILYEDLHDIILMGHSYGGMVISGVAEKIPGRIKRLIYLDAFVPNDGESVARIRKIGPDGINSMSKNGFMIPEWVKPGQQPPTDVPHSVKTFTERIVLENPEAKQLAATYILTVDSGKRAEDDPFESSAERARKRNWPVLQLEADHNPQWSTPEALVEMLLQVIKK
ncbi:MAG: alpha/beta fold hydrolase [Sphingobacteriaceae bacterium]|nr:alpha/beta fold hydrolase [Sphingobacteriaceae bacterium]